MTGGCDNHAHSLSAERRTRALDVRSSPLGPLADCDHRLIDICRRLIAVSQRLLFAAGACDAPMRRFLESPDP